MVLDDRARELVRQPSICVVATTLRDGAPHLTSMWADLEGDHIVVCTFERAQKTVSLRRDPRVGLAIINPENPYETLSITGRVTSERTDDGAMIDRLAVKYSGSPYRGHEVGRAWVVFTIEPLRIHHYMSELYP